MPVARVIRHHWHGKNWLAWLISLKNYQHSLDSYYIVCRFAGGRIAARCSLQIGRTGSDPTGISGPGSIPLKAILQAETTWGVPAAGEPAFYFCQLIPVMRGRETERPHVILWANVMTVRAAAACER